MGFLASKMIFTSSKYVFTLSMFFLREFFLVTPFGWSLIVSAGKHGFPEGAKKRVRRHLGQKSADPHSDPLLPCFREGSASPQTMDFRTFSIILINFGHFRWFSVILGHFQLFWVIVSHYQPSSVIINHYQSLSAIISHCQSLSIIFNHFQSSSVISSDCQQLLVFVSHCQLLSVIVIVSHRWLWVVGGYQW